MHKNEVVIRHLIEQRNLTLTRTGRAWRVTGPGVDLKASDLSVINPADLLPAKNDISNRTERNFE